MNADRQSAYHLERVSGSSEVDADLFAATRLYMVEDLGLDPRFAERRSQQELQRKIPKAVLHLLLKAGVVIEGRDVLDLGAGLGALSEELLLNGARLHSLEPGAAWANLTRRRLERHGRGFDLLLAAGESIPLPDRSVDLIVSLQVLEHVQDPEQVLAEAWRVLRPGGHFYLACENYLAFWEPHYCLPWLPLLPKSLGALYLRALGRSPVFLMESITYTTFPGVVRHCRKLGFLRQRDEELVENLHSGRGLKWRAMRALAAGFGAGLPRWLDDARHSFRIGIHELMRKPEA